jgi:CBS domain-containing protein
MNEPDPHPGDEGTALGVQRPESEAQIGLNVTPLRTLLQRAAVVAPAHTSILAAAQLMREQRVSSLLLVDEQQLVGIVTDRDLRNRVLADARPLTGPVRGIATADPLHVDVRGTAFDALLLMARHNIHHLPVMDGPRIAGVVTAHDLNLQPDNSAVFLAGDIHRQDDISGLARASIRIRRLQAQLAAADATAQATAHIITAITDALTTRLLALAEAQWGPPPVAYAWVAAGSQARGEQTAKSDQDNCMILDDAFDAPRHGEYFERLARYVCGGLDACGYSYCPGDIMAMNDAWRQPLRRWQQYFRRWTDEPEPQALLNSGVFFDQRCVHGHPALLDQLRSDVLRRTPGNALFLLHMASNALSREPPLGLFGGITPQRRGEHPGTVDLKYQGIVPIIDLARVHALAGGHAAVNTHERLQVAWQGGDISEQAARDLRDALEFLAVTRIRHQARQIEAHLPADSLLSLHELSNFERTQLKDAFAVVRTVQQLLGQRYRGAVF